MLVKKIDFLLAQYYWKRKLYTHFLSKTRYIAHPHVIIAYYKLGMYRSILKHPIQKSNPLAFSAYITAKIACDCVDSESITLINEFIKRYPTYVEKFIYTLATYAPKEALLISDNYTLDPLFLAGLNLRNQNYNSLSLSLQKLNISDTNNNIEFNLLCTAAYYENPEKALQYLNKIFAQNNLLPINLINNCEPIFVNNLTTNSSKKEQIYSPYKISILITTYNSQEYISYTLNSLLNQSYINLEIIIIDDCSSDNTWEILEEFKNRDNRIVLLKQLINSGTYVAKNRALSIATGEFILCHDADDWSHPQRLELQVSPLLKNNSIIATTANWFRIEQNGKIYARSIYPLSRLNPSSILFRRRQVLKKIGYWDNVRTGADSEFLARLRIVFGNKSIQKIKLPLTIGAHRADSLMNHPSTGFTMNQIPHSRLEYWESWNHWHIENLKYKRSFYLKNEARNKYRAFDAPIDILINH